MGVNNFFKPPLLLPQTVATDVHEKVLKHPHMAALKRRVGEARHALANLKPVRS